jgi:hypothetical protein
MKEKVMGTLPTHLHWMCELYVDEFDDKAAADLTDSEIAAVIA